MKMDILRQDLRFALRWMRRNPGFAAIVVLTLGLGIGANTVIFSVLDAVLLRPLAWRQPERLASLWPDKPLSRGAFVEFRGRSRSYEPLGAYSDATGFSVAGTGDPERVMGAYATPELFRALGGGAVVGRTLLPGEDQPGRDRVVVLSHAYWRQRHGGDRGVVGRQVTVQGVPRTVVGVMAPGFRFPVPGVRMWVPVSLNASDPGEFWGGEPALHAVGRLRPGVTVAQADAEARIVAQQVRGAAPWPLPAEWAEGAGVRPLREVVVGDAGTPLLLLMGAVGVVLLIACANVANLLLARGAARRQELATRIAVGAPRGRVVRQLVTESLVLSTAGGALGFLMAMGGVPALARILPADLPRAAEVQVDGRVLGFTLLLALVTGAVFGFIPTLRSSRPDLHSSLKEGAKGTGSGEQRRLSAALVTGEVALAVALAVGAGLLVRSLGAMFSVDPGFRPERVVTAHVSPPAAAYADDARVTGFYREVLERVERLPGVQSAAAVHRLPLGGEAGGVPLQVEGRPAVPGAAAPLAGEWRITPPYLQAMGIALVRGRAFTDADREGAPAVALVNEEMARRFWPGGDPVGKRIRPVWWRDWVTVVGVVADVKGNSLTAEQELEMYRPFAQGPVAEMNLVVRTALPPAALGPSLRRTVWSVDPAVPVSDVRTMREVVAGSVARLRFTMLLLALLAALALGLSAVGIYGMIAYAVSQRTREIGIRMALGATPADVLRRELARGVKMAGAGIAAGLLAAGGGARLLGSLLYGISPLDPVTFAGVALVVLGVALLASYLPAARATRVNPSSALRVE